MSEKIGLCCDHAGFNLKERLKRMLEVEGYEYVDYGTNSTDSCDYPDFAHPLGYAIDRGEIARGIAVCGTGNGIGMTLNKHQRVRAALCWNDEIATLAREHNDANILVLPGRFMSEETAARLVNIFLHTAFEGGRHERRVRKIPLQAAPAEEGSAR